MRAFLLFVLVVSATVAQAAEPYVHAGAGLSLPETIAGLKRAEVKQMPAPTGDPTTAVPYVGSGIEAVVFIRRCDPKRATTPKLIVDESMTVMKVMETQGQYKDVKMFGEPEGAPASRWARAGFTATSEQGPLVSIVAATVRNDHTIKARITSGDPKNAALVKFIPELQGLIDGATEK